MIYYNLILSLNSCKINGHHSYRGVVPVRVLCAIRIEFKAAGGSILCYCLFHFMLLFVPFYVIVCSIYVIVCSILCYCLFHFTLLFVPFYVIVCPKFILFFVPFYVIVCPKIYLLQRRALSRNKHDMGNLKCGNTQKSTHPSLWQICKVLRPW